MFFLIHIYLMLPEKKEIPAIHNRQFSMASNSSWPFIWFLLIHLFSVLALDKQRRFNRCSFYDSVLYQKRIDLTRPYLPYHRSTSSASTLITRFDIIMRIGQTDRPNDIVISWYLHLYFHSFQSVLSLMLSLPHGIDDTRPTIQTWV